MNFPERCPICHNTELEKSSRYYPKDGIIYWIHCDNNKINDVLWHFSVQIRDREVICISYAFENLGLHLLIYFEYNKTRLGKIADGANVDVIKVFPYILKFDYYDPQLVEQKIKLLATYL